MGKLKSQRLGVNVDFYMEQFKCKCGKTRRSPGQAYCLTCHAKNMREFRASHPLTEEQRKRANCRAYAKVYLTRGKIEKKPCETCGNPNSQMHHTDYSQPLKIMWLCRRCHLKRHRDPYLLMADGHVPEFVNAA